MIELVLRCQKKLNASLAFGSYPVLRRVRRILIEIGGYQTASSLLSKIYALAYFFENKFDNLIPQRNRNVLKIYESGEAFVQL